MKGLTVGKKITFGFVFILFLAVILGGTAVYEMGLIKIDSEYLAQDYAPEVDIIGSLERNSRRVMYEMRGFGFTEDKDYLVSANKWNVVLQKRLASAKELAAKTTILKKLGPALKIFEEKINHYKKLIGQTTEEIANISIIRSRMDKSAGGYLEAANSYLANQSKSMKNEFSNATLSVDKRLERLQKISLINDIIDIGNNIRVANFKAQSLRDPELYKKAIDDFSKVKVLEQKILKITFKKSDRQDLARVSNSGMMYKKAMEDFLVSWNLIQSLGNQRTEIGGQVVLEAETVSRAAIDGTKRIANRSMNNTSQANQILIWGLILTVIIGVVLSFVLVRGITAPMVRIGKSLDTISMNVGGASEELSSASQQLSSMSSEQASSVEETSASLEEIEGMVENNVSNASEAAKLSESVRDLAEEGNENMEKLQVAMDDILESNNQLEALVRLIGDIGEKTKLMDEIVFQTKLLSFNASVEAERAGEHGRGFAVVAQEVGNLAQMSGKSAKEIADIVTSSIKETERIVTENKAKVENGSKLVEVTAESLKNIQQNSGVVVNGSTQVLEASKDQAKGIKQINVAMVQIDKATQETAATAEETAASSEELAAQVDSLREVVTELTMMVAGNGNPQMEISRKVSSEFKKSGSKKVKDISSDNSWENL